MGLNIESLKSLRNVLKPKILHAHCAEKKVILHFLLLVMRDEGS